MVGHEINRLEVIGEEGRELVHYCDKMILSLQDEGRTLKVFIPDTLGLSKSRITDEQFVQLQTLIGNLRQMRRDYNLSVDDYLDQSGRILTKIEEICHL